MSDAMTNQFRVRVIDQDSELVVCEVSIPGPHDDRPIDVEVLYPDGQTIRYAREID